MESILITQFGNPATDEERTFNREFKKLRKDVECAIGRFKGRFRCLDKSGGFLQYDPEVCCKIITVCGILHNFLLEVQDRGDEEVAPAANDDDAHLEGPRGTQPQDGQTGAEFESEKRLGQERSAQVMARFIQSRARGGLQL